MKNKVAILVILLSTLSLLLSACVSTPVVSPTLTPLPTNSPIPLTTTLSPTETPVPLPNLTLKQGDFYFSIDGKTSFVLSRNLTGKTKDDFSTLLEWAHEGGTRIIRVHLIHGWSGDPWINKDWSVDEKWAQDWESFFDQAQADGIFVIPVFGVWADWNNGKPDYGSPFWQYNPLNQANGGLVNSPDELFQSDAVTQQHWMAWVKTLVERWQGRKNIAAWEIFSEINIASGAPSTTDPKGGVDEATGVDFTNKAMAIIHAADLQHRPVTLSLAGVYSSNDQWAEYYKLDSLDFIEIHPYSDTLDRELVKEVKLYRNQYQKPVMIGESGLWSMATNTNALIGIKHAIWAGLVSGAMNGRSLWGNDGYSIYSTNDRALAFQFMQVYATTELPVVHFVSGVDFSDFKPLEVTTSSEVWGAAVGNETSILGWFRDASSEPPDWNLQPTISKQSVTITIPGSAANWKVDFYDTKDGTTILSSASIAPTGNTITIPLPDFHDDIAFKMTAQGIVPTSSTSTIISASTLAPAISSTDAIAGTWKGAITNTAGTFSTPIQLSIQGDCESGKLCGTFSAPQLPCSGDLFLQAINGETYLFMEQNATGAASCTSGGYEQLQSQADGTLSYEYLTSPGTIAASTGVLKHP